MPIYEYDCPCGQGYELIVPYADREQACGSCGKPNTPLPSAVYVRPERMYVSDPDTGHRLIKNDCDNPWEGSGAENRMAQQGEDRMRVTKRQTRIQTDMGSKTNVGANH